MTNATKLFGVKIGAGKTVHPAELLDGSIFVLRQCDSRGNSGRRYAHGQYDAEEINCKRVAGSLHRPLTA